MLLEKIFFYVEGGGVIGDRGVFFKDNEEVVIVLDIKNFFGFNFLFFEIKKALKKGD